MVCETSLLKELLEAKLRKTGGMCDVKVSSMRSKDATHIPGAHDYDSVRSQRVIYAPQEAVLSFQRYVLNHIKNADKPIDAGAFLKKRLSVADFNRNSPSTGLTGNLYHFRRDVHTFNIAIPSAPQRHEKTPPPTAQVQNALTFVRRQPRLIACESLRGEVCEFPIRWAVKSTTIVLRITLVAIIIFHDATSLLLIHFGKSAKYLTHNW